MVRQIIDAKHPIDGASDHASHLTIYLPNPDRNGIKMAWDGNPSLWGPWRNTGCTNEDIRLVNMRIDTEALIAEAAADGTRTS